MTTVAILPVETVGGITVYQAVAGRRMAEGKTAGQALDALTAQYPEVERDSLLVVQQLRPDAYFSADQQSRLQSLLERWRNVREQGHELSPDEQAELESLVDAEVEASGRRAAAAAREVGK
jgi:hypothetical protein